MKLTRLWQWIKK